MSYGNSIRKRTHFVDRLTCTEVGLFVGMDPLMVKRLYAHEDAKKNQAGWWIWSVGGACKTFCRSTGRIPRGEEVANLMQKMGAKCDEIEGMILKLWTQGLCAHKTPNGFLIDK
jgi:hypothetical protein